MRNQGGIRSEHTDNKGVTEWRRPSGATEHGKQRNTAEANAVAARSPHPRNQEPQVFLRMSNRSGDRSQRTHTNTRRPSRMSHIAHFLYVRGLKRSYKLSYLASMAAVRFKTAPSGWMRVKGCLLQHRHSTRRVTFTRSHKAGSDNIHRPLPREGIQRLCAITIALSAVPITPWICAGAPARGAAAVRHYREYGIQPH